MSANNPVNWLEIPVTDLDRASAFYAAAFGSEFTPMEMGAAKMAMFPMEQGAPGAGGALVLSEGYAPSHEGTLVYFSVGSIEAALAKIAVAGGKTLLPLTPIGEHGHIAYFEDSEGNRVALHQAAG